MNLTYEERERDPALFGDEPERFVGVQAARHRQVEESRDGWWDEGVLGAGHGRREKHDQHDRGKAPQAHTYTSPCAPAFTVITILTLALGIGANTAIFSIVNGVILRPLGYPKPDQLMYLTTRFPAFGFDQFWVSPPEYLEFRELNQSFSSVGAYTTGEVNLTAGDRPLRLRSASVNDDLLTALGVQPIMGRLFRKGEADVTGPPPTPGSPPILLPPFAILSYETWRSAFGGQDVLGQMVEINGLRRDVIGVLPPGTDVMDNRTEIWMPLGLNPGFRLNRVVAVVATITLVAGVACWIPAWRASRLDPNVVLRDD